MKGNLVPGRFLMYPRFVQMLLDDLIPNLAKDDFDLLPLEHMTNLSLERIQQYKNQAEKGVPKFKNLIGFWVIKIILHCLKDNGDKMRVILITKRKK
ncbi:hypothetical protein Hanom_Chr03g00210601 [Helianthus anomalus]